MLKMYIFFIIMALASVDATRKGRLSIDEDLVPVESLPPGTLVRVKRQFGGFGGFNFGSPSPSRSFGGFDLSRLSAPAPRPSFSFTPTSSNFGLSGSNGGFSYGGGVSQQHLLGGLGSVPKNGPVMYTGNVGFKPSPGLTLGSSLIHVPQQGNQATAGVSAQVLSTPHHSVTASANHVKLLDNNFRETGITSNAQSVAYKNIGGGTVMVNKVNTPGQPASGSIATNLPLASLGKMNGANPGGVLSVGTVTNIREGQKPQSGIHLGVEGKF